MGRWNKNCLGHLGHMTNMALTPIYGKIPQKSNLEPPDQFGKKHDDPGLTLIYFTARSNLVT